MSAETVDTAAAAAPRPGSVRVHVRAALRRAAPALALFAAIRLAGAMCTALWAWHTGRHPRNLLGATWDSNWYLSVARYGYGSPTPHRMWPPDPLADLAFFPLYPGLIRGVSTALPIGALSAGLLLAWTAAAVAAWGIFAVGAHLHGRRAGTFLVALWALLPHAVIESLSYTEPLLTALAAWALYALLTDRPLWAGALAALAGLARPNGLAVAAAVLVVVGVRTWRRGRDGPVPRQERPLWHYWTAALAAPAGWLGYVLWVGARTGWGPRGYFQVQELWGSRFDFGRDTLRSVKRLFLHDAPLVQYMAAAVLAVALLLLVLLVLDRPPLPLLVYTAVLMAIALGGTGYFPSKPRFLLPAFPLLIPAAVALARARPRAVVLTTGTLAALSLGYGLYLLTMAPEPL
ncbi:hypothetical protein [Streptomyces rimosus]|uniref:hypothetical protein n=1 Tax=Streptomyces rimosus TaxID=1927 RepID=UPI000ACE18FE|nr:hypothetical protein [Streptomyces rimosus]